MFLLTSYLPPEEEHWVKKVCFLEKKHQDKKYFREKGQ